MPLPVIVHHGTPGSGLLYEKWQMEGVDLIGFDRSGYGDAPRRHGRSIADVADEVRALADKLGLEQFATWGISGGGPHALATAALLPDRCVACAAIASPAPYDAEGLDWLAGQGEANLVEWQAALQGEMQLRPLLEQEWGALSAAGAAGLRDGLATLLSEADREVLQGGVADFLHASMLGAEGVSGWVDDDLAFVRPWGFDLGSISCPVLIRHGEQDRFVSADHSRWLAARIPGAELHITATDGHLTLYERGVPEVQDWLVQARS
jgi:pimeloyl-ACP methyl ester carboxylesterase